MAQMIDVLQQSLRAAGVSVATLSVDDMSPQVMEPVAYREQPGVLGLRTYRQAFYRRLFRWKMDDGSGGALLMEPVITMDRGRYREDAMAQAKEVAALMVAHYGATEA